MLGPFYCKTQGIPNINFSKHELLVAPPLAFQKASAKKVIAVFLVPILRGIYVLVVEWLFLCPKHCKLACGLWCKDGTADTHVTWLETFMPSTRNIKTYEYAACSASAGAIRGDANKIGLSWAHALLKGAIITDSQRKYKR